MHNSHFHVATGWYDPSMVGWMPVLYTAALVALVAHIQRGARTGIVSANRSLACYVTGAPEGNPVAVGDDGPWSIAASRSLLPTSMNAAPTAHVRCSLQVGSVGRLWPPGSGLQWQTDHSHRQCLGAYAPGTRHESLSNWLAPGRVRRPIQSRVAHRRIALLNGVAMRWGNRVCANTPSPAWAGPGVLLKTSASSSGVSGWLFLVNGDQL
jgi:hypothetical protein